MSFGRSAIRLRGEVAEEEFTARRSAASLRRTTGALIRKEIAVAAGRKSLWRWQSIFLAYLAVVVVGTIVNTSGWDITGRELDPLSRSLAVAIAVFSYLGVLLVAPLITAGVVSEERERGMLEVLSAAPISTRQMFFAVVIARLATLSTFFFSAAPLLCLPVLLGGSVPWSLLPRAGLIILLGGACVALFGLTQFSRGESTISVYRRGLVLVLFTPGAWGLATAMKFLAGYVLLIISKVSFARTNVSGLTAAPDVALSMVHGALFPFMFLPGFIDDSGAINQPWELLGALLSAGGLCAFYFVSARRAFYRWVQSSLTSEPGRDNRRRRNTDAKERVESLERYTRRHARAEGLEEASEDEPEPRDDVETFGKKPFLLTTRRIRDASSSSRTLYRWSGRNAFVAKTIAERSWDDALAWGGAVFTVLLFFVFFRGSLPDAERARSAAMGGLLVGVVNVVWSLSTLLPTTRLRGDADILLSTPLTSLNFLRGALAIAAMRTWPIVVVTTIISSYAWMLSGDWSLFGLPILGIVIYLITMMFTMWGSGLGHSAGQRAAISFGLVAMFVFPLFFRGGGYAAVHPVTMLVQGDLLTALRSSALGLGLAASGLIAWRFVLGSRGAREE